MPKMLIVEKGGEIKELNSKTYNEEELFKKAGFKTADGFNQQTQWKVNVEKQKMTISLYAKAKGRAGQENKYDFPPPVDNKLFFGACVLVKTIDGKEADLTTEEWEKIYEHLFGGFENLGSEDSERSTDGDEYANVPRTKEGYIKDDFIVSSDDEFIEDSNPLNKTIKESADNKMKHVPKAPRKVTNAKPKPTKIKNKIKKTIEFEDEETADAEETSNNGEFAYTKELEEEEYV